MIAHARDTRGIVCLACLAGIVGMQRPRVRLLSRKVLFLLLLIVPRRDPLFLSEHSKIPFFFDQGISEHRSLQDSLEPAFRQSVQYHDVRIFCHISFSTWSTAKATS